MQETGDAQAVVITGAGGGLGAVYAQHLAALGAAVVVNDLDAAAADRTVAAITSMGGRALAVVGDVGDWAFARDLVAACVAAFGRIDTLVNNAGLLVPNRVEDQSPDDLARMIHVNLVGTFACGQAAIRQMLGQTAGADGLRGRVVNVVSGSQCGDIGLAGYGATKGAVASLTYAWALELAGQGIRVNAISPLAQTSMAQANSAFMAQQQAARAVTYGPLPDPAVNAPLLAFLLSPAAAAIHGQVIRLGGRMLSYMTHPQLAPPVLDGDWTEAAIARAFAETLGAQQHPLGLSIAAVER